MKKIMFNDKYGLTQAVLDGRKTMTRRIIACPEAYKGMPVRGFRITGSKDIRLSVEMRVYDESCDDFVPMYIQPKYELGEIVAIAQSYKDSGYDPDSLDRHPKDLSIRGLMKDSAGWNNKMFVKSYACKHHIKITNVKIERLQDISDEDCLKEGIIHAYTNNDGIKIYHTPHTKRGYLSTDIPQEAFEFLINKVSGKGTWESNPFVFAYEFVLFD
ncbi:MAG: ASCH domain protein [Bacteriophage sp.]|nr:MAG: ASCH domain protein [Bacteriophage sp.]